MMITIQNKTTTEIEEKRQKYLEYQRQYIATHKKEKQQYMKDNKEKLAEFVERASKHYGHVRTSRRLISSVVFWRVHKNAALCCLLFLWNWGL